jgi:DNA polymerase-4
MAASRQQLRQVWGGIYGVLYYELLHGADLQFPSSAQSRSISHQHVLEPELRTIDGARQFSLHLLAKAAERLRFKDYYCCRLGVFMSSSEGKWWQETGFNETQDTAFLLARLAQLWCQPPRLKPKKIGVVLSGLVPAKAHQGDLFAASSSEGQRQKNLSPLIDIINRKYGRGKIAFGKSSDQISAFTGHAAFQRVPEVFEF